MSTFLFKAISFVGQCCVVSREILSKKDALFSHFDRQRSIENWMQRSTFTKADPVLPGWSCQFNEKADTGISVKYYRRQSPATKSCSGTLGEEFDEGMRQ